MVENLGQRHGRKAVICDNCGDGFEADSWEDALQKMKDDGWKTVLKNHKWEHFCPECKEE